MPRSSTLKRPEGKVLRIKWRESAWRPRIIVRSVERRDGALGLCDLEARISGWAWERQTMRPRGAGERPIGSRGRKSLNGAMPWPCTHPRFARNSGLDNHL